MWVMFVLRSELYIFSQLQHGSKYTQENAGFAYGAKFNKRCSSKYVFGAFNIDVSNNKSYSTFMTVLFCFSECVLQTLFNWIMFYNIPAWWYLMRTCIHSSELNKKNKNKGLCTMSYFHFRLYFSGECILNWNNIWTYKLKSFVLLLFPLIIAVPGFSIWFVEKVGVNYKLKMWMEIK